MEARASSSCQSPEQGKGIQDFHGDPILEFRPDYAGVVQNLQNGEGQAEEGKQVPVFRLLGRYFPDVRRLVPWEEACIPII
jgi:hypothetical protein